MFLTFINYINALSTILMIPFIYLVDDLSSFIGVRSATTLRTKLNYIIYNSLLFHQIKYI